MDARRLTDDPAALELALRDAERRDDHDGVLRDFEGLVAVGAWRPAWELSGRLLGRAREWTPVGESFADLERLRTEGRGDRLMFVNGSLCENDARLARLSANCVRLLGPGAPWCSDLLWVDDFRSPAGGAWHCATCGKLEPTADEAAAHVARWSQYARSSTDPRGPLDAGVLAPPPRPEHEPITARDVLQRYVEALRLWWPEGWWPWLEGACRANAQPQRGDLVGTERSGELLLVTVRPGGLVASGYVDDSGRVSCGAVCPELPLVPAREEVAGGR